MEVLLRLTNILICNHAERLETLTPAIFQNHIFAVNILIVKAIINGKEFTSGYEKQSGTFLHGKKHENADIVSVSDNRLHIIVNHKSYTAELIEALPAEKQFRVRINGNSYTVKLKDKYDELLQQLGMDKMLSAKVNDLKAPMPGLVLDVLVQEGQQIKKGENLLVLEAMKMENNLKATNDAVVKKIKVGKGARVEKNEILIELE